VQVQFHDERLVSDAGLLIAATLAGPIGPGGAGERVGVAALPDAGRGAARPRGHDCRRGGHNLKDQVPAHFPSGRYDANSAWTVIAALAHNLARWSTLIGLPTQPVATAETRRRRL
jgi:hypothetical protein